MVESLAGAVFVDANFDVDRVWSVFEPLLQPFATLDTLRIHPVRELYELCQLQGFKLEYDSTMVGKHVLIKATVDAKNFVLTGQAEKMDSKSAKRVAAQDVLIQLQVCAYLLLVIFVMLPLLYSHKPCLGCRVLVTSILDNSYSRRLTLKEILIAKLVRGQRHHWLR